ncbi:nodulation protein NfeD [Gallaecimonas sp. GXIMD4217]|uniref:NfeD family protein n=1 Tax=Gallaecimonas sp. GXIMD4217 TaxID=3131927 RepID=UPI00311AE0F0
MLKSLRLLLLLLLAGQCWAQGSYWRLEIKGAIGPGTANYLINQIDEAAAQAEPPEFLLVALDTPGGLYSATHDINQAILASRVPIVIYVSPQGARAASAGTFMIYASHVAAMAPATHLGAASPVQIGSPGQGGEEQKESENQKTLARKQLNDAISYIRSLAELRGRNVEWAEEAVRNAATLTAAEALEQKVIEILARDEGDLLAQLDGLEVELPDGSRQLQSQGLVASDREPDWRERFIIAITDPNIAYILMLIGIYGLILEFYSPGFGVSGTIGTICLLLALLAFQMLPISYAGLALILVGLALLLAEAMVPSFGILGAGGLIAFLLGSILLFDSPDQAYRVAWPLIAAFAVTSLLFLLIVVRMLLRQRRRAAVSGLESLVGGEAVVLESQDGQVTVFMNGERWLASSPVPLQAGQKVRIEGVQGLTLNVSAKNNEEGLS